MWGFVSTLNDAFTNNKKAATSQGTVLPEVPAPQQTVTEEVTVSAPLNGQTISSPLQVTGIAKGNWFFEGTFPMTLTTLDGKPIASGYVTAQGDWMTTDSVPFSGTLNFSVPVMLDGTHTPGYLILHNSNASGDPQFDKSVVIKVQW